MRIIQKLQSIMVDIPRWGLLGLLVLAPWIYGCTRPEGKFLLSAGSLAVLGFFLLSLIVGLRLPKFNLLSVTLSILLLLQGWIMVLNPKQRFASEVFAYTSLPGAIPWLPGAVDRATVESQMLLVTGMIAAFWISGDMAFHRRWRTRVWWVICLTGASLVTLGLAQRLTGATAIFWGPNYDTGPTFFATYRYHANAGAFFNIVLPLMVARAILAFRRKTSHTSMVFWSIATLTTATCAFINVSKAGMLIAALILLAQGYQQVNQQPIEFRNMSKPKLLMLGAVFSVLLCGLIWAFGFADSLKRWIEIKSSDTYSARFPFFTGSMGNRLAGIWQNAHQDYLQALMEWGYLGGTVWAALIFGGTGLAMARHQKRQSSWDAEFRLLSLACILSMFGLLLHALVDFPLQIPSLQLYASVILGFLWNLPESGTRKRRISRVLNSERTNLVRKNLAIAQWARRETVDGSKQGDPI
jgi:hypothetical protein